MTPSVLHPPAVLQMQTYGDPPGDIVEEMTGGAGRDLSAVLNTVDPAEGEAPLDVPEHPAMTELMGDLDDKCKMQ